jgi:hypothetical protein
MAGSLLRTGNLKSFHPLGAVGNPVYLAAPQLRVAISRRLGSAVADAFAEPQRNEDGDTIDWYAPKSGPVVPWSAASSEERAEAREQLLEVRTRVEELAVSMQQETGSERQVFGRLLEHVSTFPGDEHLYLVNGHPVITFWGFRRNEAAVGNNPLLDLELVGNEPEPAPSKKRGLPWWLWLLLLLLLGLGPGLFLWRGSQQPPIGSVGESEVRAVADQDAPDDSAAFDTDGEPVTELTALDPSADESTSDEAAREYADRVHTRVDGDASYRNSYSGDNQTRSEGSRTVDSKRMSTATVGDAVTVDAAAERETEAVDGEPVPGEELPVGEGGLIDESGKPVDAGAGELPTDGPLPDELAPDEPLPDEQLPGEAVDPNAQGADESPADEPRPEELSGEPVDPNTRGPEPGESPLPEPGDEEAPPEPQRPGSGDEPEPPPLEEPEPAPRQPPDEPSPEPGRQPGGQAPGESGSEQPGVASGPGDTTAGPSAAFSAAAASRRHRYSSGTWRPSVSLQDPRTGLPLQMEYDMNNGAGKVKLKRHDGSVCSGDAQTAVQGGKAVINTTSNIRCRDGTNFGRPTLECPPGTRDGKGCVVRYSSSGTGIPVGAMKADP